MSSELLQSGLPPANDRMLTTCFLAALFHGIVILGVTFSGPKAAPDAAAPALEVVLVNDQAPAAASNPNARYVAQRTQIGTGSLSNTERARIPSSRTPAAADRQGSAGSGAAAAAQRAAQDFGDEALVVAHAPTVRVLYYATPAAVEPAAEEMAEKKPELAMLPNDEGIELHLRGEAKNQLWIAADTRESDVAVYLDSWRRKIEHVGTMNFPSVARRKNLSGTPVIEVTIGADGRLLATRVRRSSGHAEIDEAAIRILKLAAPYDPFSSELNARHDEIRIAYEWQFLGGADHGSSVLYAEPTAPVGAP